MTLGYVARKVGWALVTLLFILSANFFLFRIMPGDPVALLARSARLSQAALEHQRQVFGLDQPLVTQFITYLRETLSGNLGISIISGNDVWAMVAARLWPTVLLVGLGTAIAAVIGVLIGIKGGWERGSGFDRACEFAAVAHPDHGRDGQRAHCHGVGHRRA